MINRPKEDEELINRIKTGHDLVTLYDIVDAPKELLEAEPKAKPQAVESGVKTTTVNKKAPVQVKQGSGLKKDTIKPTTVKTAVKPAPAPVPAIKKPVGRHVSSAGTATAIKPKLNTVKVHPAKPTLNTTPIKKINTVLKPVAPVQTVKKITSAKPAAPVQIVKKADGTIVKIVKKPVAIKKPVVNTKPVQAQKPKTTEGGLNNLLEEAMKLLNK